jgi:hypothetical protein
MFEFIFDATTLNEPTLNSRLSVAMQIRETSAGKSQHATQVTAGYIIRNRYCREVLRRTPSFPMRLGFGNAVRLQIGTKNQDQAIEHSNSS